MQNGYYCFSISAKNSIIKRKKEIGMLDVNGKKIRSGKGLIGFGVFFLFGFIVLLSARFFILTVFFYLIPGIIMIVIGDNRRKKYNLYHTYISIFAHYPNSNYLELAQKLNKNPQIIEGDLKFLMANQLLSASLINEKLAIRNSGKKGPDRSVNGEYVSIVCSSCNGINKISRIRGGDCVYCGTTLSQ